MAQDSPQQYLESLSKKCKLRIYDSITRNKTRHFAGYAKSQTNGLGQVPEEDQSNHFQPGLRAEFYTDASWYYHGAKNGLLSAAIAWKSDTVWASEAKSLGRFVGTSEDGELYAIYMALKKAQTMVEEQGIPLKNVSVFCDAKFVVEQLRADIIHDRDPVLGPLDKNTGRWVLEDLLETADQLHRDGVYMNVFWVKSHQNSYGNNLADKACRAENHAALQQKGGYNPMRHRITNKEKIERFQTYGDDFLFEYLVRLSNPWFRNDDGQCFVSRFDELRRPRSIFEWMDDVLRDR